jgi:hypothetical protein
MSIVGTLDFYDHNICNSILAFVLQGVDFYTSITRARFEELNADLVSIS